MRSSQNGVIARVAGGTASCAVVCGALFAAAGTAEGKAFDTYGGSFKEVDAGSGIGGVLADGTVVTVQRNGSGADVYVGVGSARTLAATIDASVLDYKNRFDGPGFLEVSPDGSTVAVGGGFGKPIVVFGASELKTGSPTVLTGSNASVFNVNHFDAAWADNTTLGVTAGSFGSASTALLLDTKTGSQRTIIENIGGASGGIAFDSDGRLYTGNGFDSKSLSSRSVTGTIRAFDAADWKNGPVDFETEGSLIAEVLSAASLHFDADGNLFVGGGDSFSGEPVDNDYAGVLSAAAIEAALSGDPVDTPGELAAALRQLDPAGDASGTAQFYKTLYNEVTGELYVINGSKWYATIPSPGALGVAGAAGCAFLRRRRRA